jgi:type I restriction enzyme S subunit
MGVSKTDGIVPMEERIIAADIARYKMVQKDWFAYNPMRLNIGSIARWQGDACILVSPDYVVFRCLDDPQSGIEPTYLDHFRQSSAWDTFVGEGGDGGVRIRIYYKDIARLELVLPQRAEQQKIADCLSSLDEVITAQDRKVEFLNTHKRGLAQQLFPREGESLPRLRFPEFSDAPNWEEATIGSLSKTLSGGTPETTNKSYYGGTIPFIRSAEIGKGETELFLTEEGLANSAAKMVERGDVLVALYGANSGDVAIARITGAINQAILCVRPEGSKAFLYHFLTARKASILAKYIQGGQGNISGDIIKSVSFHFPLIAEQEAIAECLSSLDFQIVVESDKLDALKAHKKGLMQRLFPVMDEVSA